MHGYTKPYFQDETGRVFRDETGNLDHFDTIPFEVELGRDFESSPLKKNLVGCIVQTEQARGAQVLLSLDGGNFRDVGQVTEGTQEIIFPGGVRARDANYKIVHNDKGDAPSVDGVITYSSQEEVSFGANGGQ